jgi:hypothetical protein
MEGMDLDWNTLGDCGGAGVEGDLVIWRSGLGPHRWFGVGGMFCVAV